MRFIIQPFAAGKYKKADNTRFNVVSVPDGAQIQTTAAILEAADLPALLDAQGLTLFATPRPAPVRELSKLTIMARFVALGKWDAFKAVLATQPEEVQDAWILAQSIRTDYPLFTTYAPALKAALGLTDEQFATLTA